MKHLGNRLATSREVTPKNPHLVFNRWLSFADGNFQQAQVIWMVHDLMGVKRNTLLF
jgi:hypothetical protein